MDGIINLRNINSSKRGLVKILIVESSDYEKKIYSDMFSDIFEKCVVLKYTFINEAINAIDYYFHIDFFLINAYSMHKSCTSFIKKVRSKECFNTSSIIISADENLMAAPSKINVLNYCKSFKNVSIVKKPLSCYKLCLSILKLLPDHIHYFKTIEVVNKEMSKKLNANKTNPLGHEKNRKEKIRRRSFSDEIKYTPPSDTQSEKQIKLPYIKLPSIK